MTTNAKHWSALRIRISCDSVVTMTVWQDTINCYRGSVNELYELCNKYIKFPETLTEVNSLIATYINLFHIKFFYKSKYLPLYFLCLIILLKYCPWHHLSVKRGHMDGRYGRRCTMFYVAGTLTTLTFTHIFSMSNQCHWCESKCLSSIIHYPSIVNNNQTLISWILND